MLLLIFGTLRRVTAARLAGIFLCLRLQLLLVLISILLIFARRLGLFGSRLRLVFVFRRPLLLGLRLAMLRCTLMLSLANQCFEFVELVRKALNAGLKFLLLLGASTFMTSLIRFGKSAGLFAGSLLSTF